MKDFDAELDQLVQRFRSERDELRVKLHLAKEDLADEWSKLEERIEQLEVNTRDLRATTREVSKDVGAAAGLLIDEIHRGFDRIRRKI
ncbi:MAG: hypothetical protein H6978_02435 [Gammaproteobacteria bacterium]|nr:hypothetical protein [Gammaproteobacteria bacterium]